MKMEDFLELLEEDALDEIINMVIDLEATGSIAGDLDGDILYGVIDLSDYDGNVDDLLDNLMSDPEYLNELSDEEFDKLFISGDTFLSEEDMMEHFLLSNEDMRIKRIAERFRHIDDATF